MTDAQNSFTAGHYAPRAQAYVDSRDHSQGADLDEMEGADPRRRPRPRARPRLRRRPRQLPGGAARRRGRGLRRDPGHAGGRGPHGGGARPRQRRDAAGRAPSACPSPTRAFDAVLCRFTAHHWADVEAGLREARRVLRPGGLAVFMDAVAPPDRAADTHLQAVELLRDASHVRDYSVAEWLAMLGRAGFAVETVDAAQAAHGLPGLDRPHRGAARHGGGDPRAAGRRLGGGAGAFRDRAGRQLRPRHGDDGGPRGLTQRGRRQVRDGGARGWRKTDHPAAIRRHRGPKETER